eukprot:754082-Pelagomonas_calceolata.AAC.5
MNAGGKMHFTMQETLRNAACSLWLPAALAALLVMQSSAWIYNVQHCWLCSSPDKIRCAVLLALLGRLQLQWCCWSHPAQQGSGKARPVSTAREWECT